MGMPASHAITTIEELLALPHDGMRHELLDGEHVVTPAPSWRHQRALGAFYLSLSTDLAGQAELEVLLSPADVLLGPKTLVQPDAFVVTRDPQRDERSEIVVPRLALEILSPSTSARDRGKKRRIYSNAGVEEYWIIDMDGRVVERWRQGDERPEIVDGVLEWSLSSGASGSIDLPELFKNLER